MTAHQLKVERVLYTHWLIRQAQAQCRDYVRFCFFVGFYQHRFTTDYNPMATGYAGIGLFLQVAFRYDLDTFCQKLEVQIGQKGVEFTLSDWIVSFVAKYISGLRYFKALADALKDDNFRRECGLTRPPDERTVSRALERLDPKVVHKAYKRWIKKLYEEGNIKGRYIAIDSSFLVTYGKTYIRIGKNYNPPYRKGYRITVAYDVQADQPITFFLRPANQRDVGMLLPTVWCCEKLLGKDPQRVYLFDKGYYSAENFNRLNANHIQFVTLVKWYRNMADTIDQNLTFKEGESYAILRVGGKAITGLTGQLFVVGIKEGETFKKTEKAKEDPDSDQGEIDHKDKPFCLLTNVEDLPEVIASLYKLRWQLEEFFLQLKRYWHINTFCNTDYACIISHLQLCFYSYGLFTLFQKHFLRPNEINFGIGQMRTYCFCRMARLDPKSTQIHFLTPLKGDEEFVDKLNSVALQVQILCAFW